MTLRKLTSTMLTHESTMDNPLINYLSNLQAFYFQKEKSEQKKCKCLLQLILSGNNIPI